MKMCTIQRCRRGEPLVTVPAGYTAGATVAPLASGSIAP